MDNLKAENWNSIFDFSIHSWRDENGRIHSIKSLSDDKIISIIIDFLERAPDYTSALIDEAVLKGMPESDARDLLDLSREEILIRTENSWQSFIGEALQRNLNIPEIKETKFTRLFAEIDPIIEQAISLGAVINPYPLSRAVKLRANCVVQELPLLPIEWVDIQHRIGSLRFGSFQVIGILDNIWDNVPKYCSMDCLPIGLTPSNLHVIDRSGYCYIMKEEHALSGSFSKAAAKYDNIIDYIEDILTRLISAKLKLTKGKK